mgnify:CR=1 FL=1|jgi:hypothetical protein|tara:strand:- start:2577 stop:2765 length:189 start_codon:yes stop_codon:yes gene_type:complete
MSKSNTYFNDSVEDFNEQAVDIVEDSTVLTEALTRVESVREVYFNFIDADQTAEDVTNMWYA